jgi:hypothetical protein
MCVGAEPAYTVLSLLKGNVPVYRWTKEKEGNNIIQYFKINYCEILKAPSSIEKIFFKDLNNIIKINLHMNNFHIFVSRDIEKRQVQSTIVQ